jgi:3-methyladenine DNA glycosylase AlkC
MPSISPDEKPFLLKNVYTRELLEGYGQILRGIWPAFPVEVFLKKVFDAHWEQAELKVRMRHISACLRAVLPSGFRESAEILTESTRRFVGESGEKLTFEYMFIPDFVEQFGADDPDAAIPALTDITRWTSAEFAVRPFLLRYPERMYAQMLKWSNHESPMVRRLSSEGFRPRLPWGMGVPALKKNPSPILPVLENLKNDPAETVRRSVANNINDIAKDHPVQALQIARRWQGHSPETDWVVRHACRGLLKKGHPEALALFGFDAQLSTVEVQELRCTLRVRIGERLNFSFEIKNTGAGPADVRLEYAVDYLTSTGKTSRKVFKIKEMLLAPGQVESFAKYQRFQDFTTRKHYPGAHRIGILVNGQERAGMEFVVES